MLLAQREQPTKDDFVKLVEKDLLDIGISYEETIRSDMKKREIFISGKTCIIQTISKSAK